jgi:hypothetical protein
MQPESGSITDYAERMLYIQCRKSLFYVGQIGGTARHPQDVKSPLQLELWRVKSHGRILSCELRCDANGWEVLVRSDGEGVFSRPCATEDEARHVASGLKQDELKAGAIDASG